MCSRVSHLSWAAGGPVLGVHQACLAPKLLPCPAQPHPSPRRAQGGARTPQARCSPPGPRAASCSLACFYGAMKMTLIPRLSHVAYSHPQDALLPSPRGCRLCGEGRRVAKAGASPTSPASPSSHRRAPPALGGAVPKVLGPPGRWIVRHESDVSPRTALRTHNLCIPQPCWDPQHPWVGSREHPAHTCFSHAFLWPEAWLNRYPPGTSRVPPDADIL